LSTDLPPALSVDLQEGAPPKQPFASPANLLEQINDILAARLAREPGLRGRVLRWEEDGAGRLQLTLDGQPFSSPEEIPDPSVRALLADALKEWEAL
jgi:hypothetical protein